MSTNTEYTLDTAAAALTGGATPTSAELHLALGECRILVRSNSRDLIEQLRAYFRHVLGPPREPTLEIMAVEREAPELDVLFTDWRREPGKSGRKDSFVDLPGARLVRKVRTGMVFLQSETARIAAGPCHRYDNQVINFINSQYMNWLQQRGWHICHAAGLVCAGRALAIAGFSGGGKSTCMLRLLERDAVQYLTNDRLFIRREGDALQAVGIPKLPRVNPGTIVHNSRLHGLMTDARRSALLALPADELWHLEEKFDVPVEQVYGAARISAGAALGALLVLNWQRGGKEPLGLERVDLHERRELLSAIMKSPGPFYQYPDGSFYQDDTPLGEDAYLAELGDVAVYEATGRVDFEGLDGLVTKRLLGQQKV